MFTDPVAQVRFKSPKSGREWIFAPPSAPFLTGVAMLYEFGRTATLQLTFDAPYDEAIAMLGSDTPFAIGMHAQARIGYASRPDWWTPWFGGFLKAGGDGLTLDANGLSGQITVQVTAEGAHYTISKELVVLDQSPKSMLEKCIAAMGLLPALSPGALDACQIAASYDPDSFASFKTMWHPLAYARLTAWEAIKRICALMNLTYWIGPDVTDPSSRINTVYVATELEVSLGFIKQAATGSKADPSTLPRPTFRLRGVVDLSTSTFPCLSWAPEGGGASATWLVGGDDQAGKGVLIAYIDQDTGKVVEKVALPEEQQVATAGSLPAIQQDLSLADEGGGELIGDGVKQDGTPAVYASEPMPPGAAGASRAQNVADWRQTAGNPAQQGVITSLGLPWVIPGMYVNLAGAGEIYNGPYLVQKATHTWGPGSYEMSLTVMRQGAGGVDPEGEKKTTPAGQVPE
ncbi:MAG: hypothetical protein WC683_01605 [bacterium]